MKFNIDDSWSEFWTKFYRARSENWHEVRLPVSLIINKEISNEEIYSWLDQFTDEYHGTGQCWIFKHQEHAAAFLLRWS